MSPRDEIENLLSIYAWAFDMPEFEQMPGCFTVDAVVDFSGTVIRGRDEVVANLKRLRQGFADQELAPWHVMSNLLIREETSTAIESTCFYTIFVKDRDGLAALRGIGYYEDRFATEDGRWRVERRRVMPGGVL
jgi:hypothetical protein